MRFVRLELRAFGSFTNAPPLEFGGGRGLHLILGPNEAGKSTALRAIRRLLFGFPLQAKTDIHFHDYDDLKIGAILRGEDGLEFDFVRRKKPIANSLLSFDGSTPRAHTEILPFLGGLDETRFNELFSMDHEELIKGGEAILGGGGRLGEMLFAAGSGLVGIKKVLEKLKQDAEDLFKPSGNAQNPPINLTLKKLKDAQKAASDKMVTTPKWVEADRDLKEKRLQLEQAEAEIKRVDSAKRRLEAISKALEVLPQHDDVSAQLDRCGDVPILDADFVSRRRGASLKLAVAKPTIAKATQALEELNRKLDDLGPLDPVLAEAEAITHVHANLGVYLQALREQPGRRSKLARDEVTTRALLAGYLPDRTIDQADSLPALAARRGAIQELVKTHGALHTAYVKAVSDVEAACLPGLADRQPAADEAELVKALQDVIERATKGGDLDSQLDEQRAEREEAEKKADVEVRALPLWSGSLGELETLKIPPDATIDRFAKEFQESNRSIDSTHSELKKAKAKFSGLEREIESDRISGLVPNEFDLNAQRSDRDESWKSIRDVWLDGLESIVPSAKLADDFEAATQTADETADRLRREAGRIGEQARREAERQSLVVEIAELNESLAQLRASQDQAAYDWVELWRTLGLEPFMPTEMKDWMTRVRAAVVANADLIRKLSTKEHKVEKNIHRFRSELGFCLKALGEPPEAPTESLAVLIARARRAVARVDQSRKLDNLRSVQSNAHSHWIRWLEAWDQAVGPLGLDKDTSTDRALAVLNRLDETIQARKDLDSLRGQIAESDRHERSWLDDLEAVLRRLGDAPVVFGIENRPEDVARRLTSRLESANKNETTREGLLTQKQAQQTELDEAKAEANKAEIVLRSLIREARCDSIDDFEAVEKASEDVIKSTKERQNLIAQLTILADKVPLGDFLEETRAADPSTIEAAVATLETELEPLDERCKRLRLDLGAAEDRFSRMDGRPDAADARQDVAGCLAHLALDVEKYAKLRLASAVLRDAVEKYREAHQGPVLKRAEALFADLTLGSFSGLLVDYGDKGEPILLGVRGDGSKLKVNAMSEGTADQLYLALRLASLHAHLDAHEPMPLVLDDILVNFDDDRAAAAIRALAELSARTQVLFFTHHAHLEPIARASTPESAFFVHRLSVPPARASTNGQTDEPLRSKRKKKATATGEDSELLR